MFTGLVKDIGIIQSSVNIAEGIELTVKTNLISDIQIDDSIAINGVCQTAVAVNGNTFKVQAVQTTLEKTTLGKFKVGDKVNLELAMALGERMGGHIVQGHVNSKALLKAIVNKGQNYLLEFSLPSEELKYIINEGSIAINGISLTISKVSEFSKSFQVSIIPHTYDQTTLSMLSIGDEVNIEFDVIAKYVENMLKYNKNKQNNLDGTISTEWLSTKGF